MKRKVRKRKTYTVSVELLSPDKKHPGYPRFASNNFTSKDDAIVAWYWFKKGWEELENKLKAEATNWWCNYNG